MLDQVGNPEDRYDDLDVIIMVIRIVICMSARLKTAWVDFKLQNHSKIALVGRRTTLHIRLLHVNIIEGSA